MRACLSLSLDQSEHFGAGDTAVDFLSSMLLLIKRDAKRATATYKIRNSKRTGEPLLKLLYYPLHRPAAAAAAAGVSFRVALHHVIHPP